MGFLVTAAILNRVERDSVEAFSILIVSVVGAIVGFAYVFKAARALDVMQDASRAIASVTRDGKETRVKAEELVPGDIVALKAGDCVSADARLVEAVQLETQESALTGKHTAIKKRTSPVAKDAPLDQRQSMVYLGTMIGSGSGFAVVVATGVNTELAKIATLRRP
jgi:Ca2+-transporting ATPase